MTHHCRKVWTLQLHHHKQTSIYVAQQEPGTAVVLRTECAMATGHLKLSPPTSVVNTVCYLHLLVHLETFPRTCRAGLLRLLLRLLDVLLPVLTVNRRGVHY